MKLSVNMLSTALCMVYLMATKHLRIGQRIRIAYKNWKSSQYEMKKFHGPIAGNMVQCIVYTNTGSIVIKKSELSLIVHVTITKVQAMMAH